MKGIYILTNKDSGLQYVGKSNNMQKRISKHFAGKSGSPAVINAIQKHHRDGFHVQMLPYPYLSEAELLDLEAWLIKHLNTYHNGYNCTEGGETNPMDDPKNREKVSKATSEQNKKNWQDPEYRKRMTEQTSTGENGKKMSEDERKRRRKELDRKRNQTKKRRDAERKRNKRRRESGEYKRYYQRKREVKSRASGQLTFLD